MCHHHNYRNAHGAKTKDTMVINGVRAEEEFMALTAAVSKIDGTKAKTKIQFGKYQAFTYVQLWDVCPSYMQQLSTNRNASSVANTLLV